MTAKKALVTFVLLAYKQQDYIRQAVEGAFSQTYSPLEIIISDDASPDGTFDIIREMTAAYNGPHKVIINRNESNLGLGPHVKTVLAMASGDWVVTAAGDDISLPHRTSELMEAAERHPNLGGIWSSYETIDHHGATLHQQPGISEELLITSNSLATYLDGFPRRLPNHASGCAAAWHRRVFSINNFIPDNCWCEDLFFSIRTLALGHDLLRIPLSLVEYRCHESNLSGFRRGTSDESIKIASILEKSAHTCLLSYDDVSKILNQSSPGIRSDTAARFLEVIRMMVHKYRFDIKLHNNADNFPFSDIWNLRKYYSKKTILFLTAKSILRRINIFSSHALSER